MNEQYNKKLVSKSKTLRKSMTKEERHLWYDFLKGLPVTVRRQKIFDRYIVDFYIPSHQIIIELDGSQHYTDAHLQKDHERDLYLKNLGCTILRYSNADINQRFPNVCEDIYQHLNL